MYSQDVRAGAARVSAYNQMLRRKRLLEKRANIEIEVN